MQLHTRLCAWLIRMEACCSKVQAGKAAAPPVPDIVRARGEALFNGILLVSAATRLFRDVVAMHFLIDKRTWVLAACCARDCVSSPLRVAAISRRTLTPLAQCISMVKVIEQSLQRYAACFAHSAAPLLRENARDLMPLFHAARVRPLPSVTNPHVLMFS